MTIHDEIVLKPEIAKELKTTIHKLSNEKKLDFLTLFCYLTEITLDAAALIGLSKEAFYKYLDLFMTDYRPCNEDDIERLMKLKKDLENDI